MGADAGFVMLAARLKVRPDTKLDCACGDLS